MGLGSRKEEARGDERGCAAGGVGGGEVVVVAKLPMDMFVDDNTLIHLIVLVGRLCCGPEAGMERTDPPIEERGKREGKVAICMI